MSVAGCSGGSGSDPVVPSTDTEDMGEVDDAAVPVPFFDEKTGENYVLMLTQSQADCLLQQDVQGVTDIDAALAACNIDKGAVQE